MALFLKRICSPLQLQCFIFHLFLPLQNWLDDLLFLLCQVRQIWRRRRSRSPKSSHFPHHKANLSVNFSWGFALNNRRIKEVSCQTSLIKANVVGFRLRLRYVSHPSTSIKLFHSSFKKFCPFLRRSTHITTTHFQSVLCIYAKLKKILQNIFKFRSNCARILSRNFGKFRKMFGFRDTEDLYLVPIS